MASSWPTGAQAQIDGLPGGGRRRRPRESHADRLTVDAEHAEPALARERRRQARRRCTPGIPTSAIATGIAVLHPFVVVERVDLRGHRRR